MSATSPLSGRTVVATRAADQAPALRAALEALGASVLEVPVIEVGDPPDDGAALAAALDRLHTYDWLVFTSAEAVRRVLGVAAHLASPPRIAVVGPATAAAVRACRHEVALMPERALAESLVEAFPPGPARVLFPRALQGRDVVVDGLRSKGCTVDLVAAYATRPVRTLPSHLLDAAGRADAVTFTSSSTVDAFCDVFGTLPVGMRVVCIGPVTADTAHRRALRVDRVADPHTLDGLVAAVAAELAPVV